MGHEVKHCLTGHFHSQSGLLESERVHCARDWTTITVVTDPELVDDRLARHFHETGERMVALADGVCTNHCTIYLSQ